MTLFDDATRVSDIRLGQDPAFDAWFYTFRAENNIEHQINPGGVAGPEQLAFIAALAEHEIYVPCSDATFLGLLRARRSRQMPDRVRSQYARAWSIVTRLLRSRVPDNERRRVLLTYCRHRFQGSLALGCILPSRLIKRLIMTIMSQLGDDPWNQERLEQNRRLAALFTDPALMQALDALPRSVLLAASALRGRAGARRRADNGEGDTGEHFARLGALRQELDNTLLARLFYLAAWLPDTAQTFVPDLPPDFSRTAEAFVPEIHALLSADTAPGLSARTFLYLCDSDGGLVADLAVIRSLLALGHRVIYAVKESPFFLAPVLADFEQELLPTGFVPEACLLRDKAVTKNTLLRQLRERRFIVIDDGTSERLNFYRSSVTFARAWKECDVVLAKGRRNKEALLNTSTAFTRDIFCFWQENGEVRMQVKPRADWVRKFSEADLTRRAATLIKSMRAARDQGKAVMFYSCIIGSIPGQTRVAVSVAEAFVGHLRGLLDDVFVINPVEYFEDGMDGDDLMFMWEQVQRSGLITIWRFQSVDDIEASFSLMGRKVPPAWSGKDATFSTGCTKEMHIALDMQRSHPELQIIGPAPEKFFRRRDYGVGKFFDAGITG